MGSREEHEFFMRQALRLASEAASRGEVPVGAVVTSDGKIVGQARNRVEEFKDPTAHAEMLAIRDALGKVGGFRLTNCQIYVTLEPCAMCAGAIVHARPDAVFIGTEDPKTGACGSVMNILEDEHLNHHPQVIMGVLRDDCSEILKIFFKRLRRK